jgi:chemotaxis protein MotB
MASVKQKTKRQRAPMDPLADPPRPDGWQMVYTGFVLILLCFFIMLTSFASFQESRITQFVRSFSNAVTVFKEGNALEKGETIISNDAAMVDKDDPLARLFEKVNQLGRQNGLGNVDVRRTPRGVIMTLSEKMLFASGSATLSMPSYPLLRRVAAIIKTVGVPVEIEGHTDDVPIRTEAYPTNWELSTARAVNVLRYLTENQGVDRHKISAVGMSQYHPLVANTSDENRYKNRRVEIIFKPEPKR